MLKRADTENYPPKRNRGRVFRYILPVIVIIVAAGLRIWPLGALELRIPWVTFYPAVMNIGYNPTFQDRRVQYEVHILDFDQEIYGQIIRVYLVERLRSEVKFESIDQLKDQICRDVEQSRGILTGRPTIP